MLFNWYQSIITHSQARDLTAVDRLDRAISVRILSESHSVASSGKSPSVFLMQLRSVSSSNTWMLEGSSETIDMYTLNWPSSCILLTPSFEQDMRRMVRLTCNLQNSSG